MQIKPNAGNLIRPEAAGVSSVSKTDKPVSATAPVAAVAPKAGDAVQISDAGRALAARGHSDVGLTPERTAQIRQRVLDGAYNSLAVVDEVARRVLGSGDL
ncbi:MAG: hypothetical protein ABJE47_10985 [bacterium]